jgi:TadE-like protein
MRLNHRPGGRGQALVEFALVFPLFLLVLVSIITFGLYIFYNQQLANAANEAARYAAIHSSTAQCPTVSRINPIGPNQAQSYFRCDAPEAGWPRMTAAARKNIWGMAPNQVSLTACWSGYTDSGSPPNADVQPTAVGATFTDCTMQGVDPQTNPNDLSCPAPATTSSASGVDSGKADGDDKASALGYANSIHYPTTVTVYACFVWTPPMAGFVIIPQTITLRSVITEVLQRQQ